MEFWLTSCPIGPTFAKALRASFSLSSGYHPQSNGQAKSANQDLELALRCVATFNPSTWSQHLPWVEYAHNTLTCSMTGLFPFKASLSCQPPLLSLQEQESTVPSNKEFFQRARETWKATMLALECAQDTSRRSANCHRQHTPSYQLGQFLLATRSRKDPPLHWSLRRSADLA